MVELILVRAKVISILRMFNAMEVRVILKSVHSVILEIMTVTIQKMLESAVKVYLHATAMHGEDFFSHFKLYLDMICKVTQATYIYIYIYATCKDAEVCVNFAFFSYVH